MFDNLADATEALQARFSAPQAARIVATLVPAIAFEPAFAEPGAPGTTRFGGRPDRAVGAEWPRPPTPDDADAIAARGNKDAASDMRRHLALGLPCAFMVQVDLAEAAALGSTALALPPDGRLLFFYDLAVGPWETGTRPARVVWDRSPREELASLEVPADLGEAAAREREGMDAIRAEHGGTREGASEEGTIYGAPGRVMRMRPVLMLPHSHAIELQALPELAAAYGEVDGSEKAEALRDAYHDLLADDDDFRSGRRWRRHQLLGSPRPEQDDPRLDAVVASEFQRQRLSWKEWMRHRAGIMAQAHDWLLLLQIDLSDWMQADLVEGTVYFVIRTSDLAERRFDQVVAVYQQT